MIAPGERASPTLEEPVSPSDALVASRVPAAVAPTGQQLLEEFVLYGRQRPFEEITRRYAAMVFNVCFRVTKDKHDAEDATQAVFLTLAVQAKRGAEIKALGPWLQQVAKRLSLDARRGNKRRKTREERHQDEQERRRSAVDTAATPPADLDELKTILHEELQKLPAKYRLPLILHYFGGMTREEMAAELKTKPSTLGVRIFRGREMLAGRLNGRGVHLPAGAVAVAIGYLVKRTVSDAMVASTSHAAMALARGADYATVGHLMGLHGAGSAGHASAAHVLGLARRASHVLVIGKVRVTVAVALLAGTSLGAGVRAFTLLPPMTVRDIQQMISAGVGRLVRPMTSPLPRMLSRGDPQPARPAVADAVVVRPAGVGPMVLSVSSPPVVAAAVTGPSSFAVVAPIATPSAPVPTVPRSEVPGVATAGPAATARQTPGTGSATAAAAGSAGGTAADAVARRTAADPTAVRANPLPSLAAQSPVLAAASGQTATAAADLYVPAGLPTGGVATGTTMLAAPAAQVQVVQVPAVGGSVTESNGVVRGYGVINRTGTLTVSGKVVADGGGQDRTLNLTSFSAVQVAPAGASTAATGFYAAAGGRLTLPVVAVNTPAATVVAAAAGPTATPLVATVMTALPYTPPKTLTYTWGGIAEVGGSAMLSAVNSVNLTVANEPGATAPTSLSLLATDRSDAPAVPAADGAPVGLWAVGSEGTPLADVQIMVRYDDHLVDELGGVESAVELWTLGDQAGASWQPVDPATLDVDTDDHLVSGSATDVSYFAVTVPPAAGVDVGYLTAHPAADVVVTAAAPTTGVVPEPASLSIAAAAGVLLLGRRRRRGNPRPV